MARWISGLHSIVAAFVAVSSIIDIQRPLHTTTIFTKIFLKRSLGKSLSIYKTVEKVVAVVKKICSVYGR